MLERTAGELRHRPSSRRDRHEVDPANSRPTEYAAVTQRHEQCVVTILPQNLEDLGGRGAAPDEGCGHGTSAGSRAVSRRRLHAPSAIASALSWREGDSRQSDKGPGRRRDEHNRQPCPRVTRRFGYLVQRHERVRGVINGHGDLTPMRCSLSQYQLPSHRSRLARRCSARQEYTFVFYLATG